MKTEEFRQRLSGYRPRTLRNGQSGRLYLLISTYDASGMNGQATIAHPTARITIDPARRSGQPCIRNLRITVKDILEYRAGGMTEEQLLQEFPELEPADFAAVYGFAAEQVGHVG